MLEPIVSISHLTHRYGDRTAVDDLSLDVRPGELFGFLGPNGSGKTTLFRILSTLIPAAPGTVRLLGMDAATNLMAIRQRIGVVFQSPSLDRQLTARENLRHHGHLYGFRGATLEQRIDSMLSRVALLDRADERVDGFSGGMRRRVELAKGLLSEPKILLLDEPSTGLDPGARIDLWQALADIRAGGVTILITTHLMDEADRCSRLAIMLAGKLIACDEPLRLKQAIGGDVITVTSKSLDDLERLLQDKLGMVGKRFDQTLHIERRDGHQVVPAIIEAAPGLVESISVGKPTLEDVFIQVTGKRFTRDPQD